MGFFECLRQLRLPNKHMWTDKNMQWGNVIITVSPSFFLLPAGEFLLFPPSSFVEAIQWVQYGFFTAVSIIVNLEHSAEALTIMGNEDRKLRRIWAVFGFFFLLSPFLDPIVGRKEVKQGGKFKNRTEMMRWWFKWEKKFDFDIRKILRF